MKDIERYTKSKLEKHPIPTVGDVEEKKVGAFFEEVKRVANEGKLSKQIQWLENFCENEDVDYSMVDIAAALLKLAMGEEEKEEIIEEKPKKIEEKKNLLVRKKVWLDYSSMLVRNREYRLKTYLVQ